MAVLYFPMALSSCGIEMSLRSCSGVTLDSKLVKIGTLGILAG